MIGSGPSVRNFSFSTFRGLRIGIGDMPWRAPELGPYDYWVTANNVFPLPWIPSHSRLIAKSNTRTLVLVTAAFGGQEEREARMNIDKIIKDKNLPPIVVFDQRHIGKNMCLPVDGCCVISELAVRDAALQELIRSRSNLASATYGGSQSVAFHGIGLAILLGANPIFVTGIELPLRRADYTYYHPWKISPAGKFKDTVRQFLAYGKQVSIGRWLNSPSIWTEHELELLSDLTSLGQAAQETHQQIINTSESSLLSRVPTITTIVSGG